jgi:hypothetical protein
MLDTRSVLYRYAKRAHPHEQMSPSWLKYELRYLAVKRATTVDKEENRQARHQQRIG